jgi:hypothetical protein
MDKTTTITVPTAAFNELMRPYVEAWKAEYYAQQPTVDWQYSLPEVADILNVTPETVRGYLKLATSQPKHPRALHHVDTTGTPRGYRVLLSDLTAWQQRNRRPSNAPLEIPVRRPPRRQS